MAFDNVPGDVLDAVLGAFRRHGYEGASLSRISEATGLGKSSLYHYFPKGKDDMARAAADRVVTIFTETFLTPLLADGPPDARLKDAVAGLRAYYGDGSDCCLVAVFSVGDAASPQAGLAAGLSRGVLDAFAKLARDAGAAPADAKRRAEAALVLIEGGLVVARALADAGPFRRALDRLPEAVLSRGAGPRGP